MAIARPQLAVYLSPSDIAVSRGINVLKVLTWIKSGELKAVNVATCAGRLPRWRIFPATLKRLTPLARRSRSLRSLDAPAARPGMLSSTSKRGNHSHPGD